MHALINSRKKPIIATAVILVVVASIAVAIYFWRISSLAEVSSTPTDASPPDSSEQTDTIVRVAAMGDMLAHDSIIENAENENSYDFGAYFQKIRPLYNDADIVFCNQEGPSAGATYGISGYPTFNAPTEFASGLKEGAGCNLINLANNHMGDKGVAATNATIDVWRQLQPLAVAGANRSAEDQQRVSYAEIKGIKIGFVTFADFNNNRGTPAYSVNLYHDEPLVRKLVGTARKEADVVIASMHWGTENSTVVNASQLAQTNLLASLGVDVIIGTGPHVLQKVEKITRPDGGEMTVWYSLGNMLSSQLNIPELISGVARFDVVKSADGRIKVENLAFEPTYMHYEWTASEKARGTLLARKNFMIYPFSEASAPLSRSQLNTTIDAQRQVIVETLGPLVNVK